MLFVILTLATGMAAAWLMLLGRVTQEDWVCAAYSKVFDNLAAIEKTRQKYNARRLKLLKYQGILAAGMGALLGGTPEKAIRKLELSNERLQGGDLRGLNIFALPGYVLQREYVGIGKGNIHKTIMAKSNELYGRKHSPHKTTSLLAKLLSYPVIGVSVTLTLGTLLLGTGDERGGLAVLGIGTVLILIVVFALYDELSDQVKKRRLMIGRQFPHVVSKLALLVTSGMIMDRAWKETAFSQESELYMEMRKTSEELDNLVSPEAAYGSFINRCNTKETAKLAAAIMQNLSKGNAEIGKLLKDMAREAWQERRHLAKRDAEKANSKLMIPTMMLFVAILIMLMVPVAINFTGI